MFKKIQLVESTGVYKTVYARFAHTVICLHEVVPCCRIWTFNNKLSRWAQSVNLWRREPGQALPRNSEIRNNYLDAKCNFRNTQFESSCIELLMIMYILGILPKMYHHR